MSGPTLILIAAAAFVALRLWLRGRRHRNGRPADSDRAPREALLHFGTGEVGLVALREVRERTRGRLFRAGTVLILTAVAAAIVVPVLDRSRSTYQVGVVGTLASPARAAILSAAKSAGTTARFVDEPGTEAAHGDLRSGRVKLVVVDGRTLVVKKAIASTDDSTTAGLVRAVSRTLGLEQAVAAAHLTPAQAGQLAHARPLTVTSLQPGTAETSTRTPSVIGLILVFLMLTQYNTWTLIGVMEEKSSRVVEVLLAAVRPVQLLGGKVLGIGLVVFAQATLIVLFALGLAEGVGSDLLHGTEPLVLAATLLWLLLGYAFYSWVYAAAGSMAERQDQVQSLALPLMVPTVLGYIVSLTTISHGHSSTFFDVLAYLPPTAPFAMPVLVGFGTVTWWQFAASAAVSILCTVGVARAATGIYRKAVLRTGRRVRLRDVVTLSR